MKIDTVIICADDMFLSLSTVKLTEKSKLKIVSNAVIQHQLDDLNLKAEILQLNISSLSESLQSVIIKNYYYHLLSIISLQFLSHCLSHLSYHIIFKIHCILLFIICCILFVFIHSSVSSCHLALLYIYASQIIHSEYYINFAKVYSLSYIHCS